MTNSNTLTITSDQTEWTRDQVAALQQLGVSRDVQPADLNIFLTQCKRTGLDPFSRQIYMISRKQKTANGYETRQTIQVGIDGLRMIAHRVASTHGETFSMSDTVWADRNGGWHDVWLNTELPAAAKVAVKRGNGVFSAVAVFTEYAPMFNGKLTGVWATKPALMIAKCAEALALRKAFPSDMSGIYTDDEMSNTPISEPPTPVVVPAGGRAASREQREQLLTIAHQAGIRSRLQAIEFLKTLYPSDQGQTLQAVDARLLLDNREQVEAKARAWLKTVSIHRTQPVEENHNTHEQETMK